MQHEDYADRQARLAKERAEYSETMAHLLAPRIKLGDWAERATREVDDAPRDVAFLMALTDVGQDAVVFRLEFIDPATAGNPDVRRFDTFDEAREAYEALLEQWQGQPDTSGVRRTPGNPGVSA